MPNLINMPPFTEDGNVYVVVETPRGSRVKFDCDPKLKTFTLSKSLLTGLTTLTTGAYTLDPGRRRRPDRYHGRARRYDLSGHCPYLPRHRHSSDRAEEQRQERAQRPPVCRAKDSHAEQALTDVRDLSKPIQQELEKFFKATDELEDKKLNIIGWKGPKAAVEAIKNAAKSSKKNGN
jgi:inorganic pyrophosphatase